MVAAVVATPTRSEALTLPPHGMAVIQLQHPRVHARTVPLATAFADGKKQLDVAKRHAVVYSLYAPKAKSIMEMKLQ